LAENSDWIPLAAKSAGNYVSELASDIWHGEFSKHPVAVGLATTAATMALGGGAAWAIARRIGASAAAPLMASETGEAVAGSAMATPSGEAAAGTGLMEKLLAEKGPEIATQRGNWLTSPARVMAPDPYTKELLGARTTSLQAMGMRADQTAQSFNIQLSETFGARVLRVDPSTTIGRSTMWHRIIDDVVRTDIGEKGVAIEKVAARMGGKDTLHEVRLFDFNSGEMRSYDFATSSDKVLRATTARGIVSGSWLTAAEADAELEPVMTNVFSRSADGRSIAGIHESLPTRTWRS
jgi:hypothetical protein